MLSQHEKRALAEIDERKERDLEKAPTRLVPAPVKEAASEVGERVRQLPGADKAAQAAAAGYHKAANGVGKFMTRSSQLTLSHDRILKAYRRSGETVDGIADVQALDLEVIDRTAKFARLNHLYAGAAMVEGAGAAAVIAGGGLLAAGGAAGAGVAAAPGAGLIAGAVAGDTAAVLVASSRVVAHTALYYGFDPEDPKEEVFMMSIIGLGSATTQSAKLAAYGELSRLTQLLVRNAPWEQLSQAALVAVSKKFAEQFGAKLTKKKLGQFVPVAGIAIGGGLNYAMIDRIAGAAYWTYRERFLRGKLGEALVVPSTSVEVDGDVDLREDPIDVLGILEEQGVDLTHDAEPG